MTQHSASCHSKEYEEGEKHYKNPENFSKLTMLPSIMQEKSASRQVSVVPNPQITMSLPLDYTIEGQTCQG